MIRSELVRRIANDNPHLAFKDAERLVGAIFKAISDQLVVGGRVELRDFGAFSTRPREARTGRDPRTGEAVDVAAMRVPFFRAGKAVRDMIGNVPASDTDGAP